MAKVIGIIARPALKVHCHCQHLPDPPPSRAPLYLNVLFVRSNVLKRAEFTFTVFFSGLIDYFNVWLSGGFVEMTVTNSKS